MNVTLPHASLADGAPAFLAQGGETGRLIAVLDWSQTPLGPVEGWPGSLKTAVGLLLRSPVPIVLLWGEEGVMLYNDAYSAFAGGRHPKLLGRCVREGWPEVADFNDHVMRVGLSGGTLSYRDQELTLHRHGRPEQVFMNLDYSPVLDETGKPAGVMAVVVETTEKVMAERRLRDSEARFRAVQETSVDGFMVLESVRGEDGRIADFRWAYANEAAGRLVGRPRDWFAGRRLLEEMPGNKDDGLFDAYARVVETGEPWVSEIRYAHEGIDIYFRIAAAKVGDGFAVTFADLSARRRAEERVREEAERVQLALDAGAIIGTWVWDLPSDRFTVDEAFAEAFGIDPAPGRDGLSLAQVIAAVHPDDKPGLIAAIDEAIGRGGRYAHQYRVRRRDGAYRWIEANGRVDHGPDGAPLRFPGVLLDVEERRKVEAERDGAMRLLQTFAEAVPGVVYAKDRDGRMLVANRGTTELIGKPPELYLGKTDAEFLDDRAQAEAVMMNDRRIMETGVAEQVEEEIRLPDGAPAVWLSTKAPLRDETGAVAGLIGSSVDITGRKQAEARLAESEQRFRFALDAAGGIGTWDWDIAADTVHTSARFAEMYGLDPERATAGLPVAEYMAGIHPDDRAEAARLIDEALRTGGDYRAEYRIVGRNGEVHWVIARGRCLKDKAGRAIRFPGVTFDITERKLAENRLRESEEKFQAIANSIDQMIWSTRPDGHHDYFNDRWYEYTGVPHGSTDGEAWNGMFHPDDQDRAWRMWRQSLETGEPYHIEYRLRRRSGEYRWVIGRAQCVRDAQGRITRWYGTCTDIHDLKSAEAALRESEARLRFMSELDEALRHALDAPAAMAAAAALLGTHLGASRCAYADVDADSDRFVIRSDFTAHGVASSAGTYSLDLFGARAAADMRGGRTLVVRDVSGELAPGGGGEMFLSIGIGAIVCCPLVKDGRLVAMMAVHQGRARDWRGDEIGLVEAVVERCWAHVERVGAEARLRESEARLKAVFDAAPIGIVLAEAPSGRIVGGNAQAERIFGHPVLPSPNVESYREWEARHADGRRVEPEEYPLAPVIRDGAERAELEVLYRRGDGRDAWVRLIAGPIRDEKGGVAGGVVAALDIDRKKRAEAELRRLNETLEAQVAERTADRDRMWRLSTDVMLVARFDGAITAVNPAWEGLLGWREDELVGTSFFDLVHPDDREPTLAEAGRLGEGLRTQRFENRYRARDGSYRWLSWIAVPDERFIHAVGRDVTAEKARQAELEAAQEALRQAQKMEAVGQLTGGIAHDFNNLLTGIIGSLDMLQRRVAQGRAGDIDRFVSAATASANRAAALTHRLLAFSRRQPLDPKPVDANRLVTSMEELLRRTLGEAYELEIVTAGGLWQTRCDPHQLESALLNLAINARDAMPDGGKLTIETCNAHLDSAYAAQSREVRPGQYVCICVSDTGTGMSKETVSKAFDPFFTTKPIGQGTGLGLSMVYGFARQSDGYAKIYSELDRGTTVKLYLPRFYGEDGASEEAVRAAELPAPRAEHGEVVLVVEDEPAVRALVTEVLADLGYRAIEAADGPSGLKILESRRRIDLLVTDVGLPGLNGRQLADAARARRPGLKVLFMTGYAENAAIANGFLAPGMELITKPFAVDALASRIRGIIEKD